MYLKTSNFKRHGIFLFSHSKRFITWLLGIILSITLLTGVSVFALWNDGSQIYYDYRTCMAEQGDLLYCLENAYQEAKVLSSDDVTKGDVYDDDYIE